MKELLSCSRRLARRSPEPSLDRKITSSTHKRLRSYTTDLSAKVQGDWQKLVWPLLVKLVLSTLKASPETKKRKATSQNAEG